MAIPLLSTLLELMAKVNQTGSLPRQHDKVLIETNICGWRENEPVTCLQYSAEALVVRSWEQGITVVWPLPGELVDSIPEISAFVSAKDYVLNPLTGASQIIA